MDNSSASTSPTSETSDGSLSPTMRYHELKRKRDLSNTEESQRLDLSSQNEVPMELAPAAKVSVRENELQDVIIPEGKGSPTMPEKAKFKRAKVESSTVPPMFIKQVKSLQITEDRQAALENKTFKSLIHSCVPSASNSRSTTQETIEVDDPLNAGPDSFLKSKLLTALINCPSLDVGDYECKPPSASNSKSEELMLKVLFTKKRITFTLPHAKIKYKFIKCGVPSDSIVSIFYANAAHPRLLPIILLSTLPTHAAWLRAQLGLNDEPWQKNYYCTWNGDGCQKYITIQAESLTDMDVATIKVFYGKKVQELSYENILEQIEKSEST